MKASEHKLILNWYDVGGEPVYGLKTHDGVLLPTHAPHTRYYFAKQKQTHLILETAVRIEQYQYVVTGDWVKKQLKKINQCTRIINYYHNK